MSLKDFQVLKELGKGAFASVSQVKRIQDGKIYALKRVKIVQMSTKERENALNEVRLLASVSHPNIVGYCESFFDEDTKTLNIVMELADDGDLDGKIKKHQKNRTNFSENEIWSILIQLTQAIKALHDKKIMHRDLKSANIFSMKNGLIKIGDFNVSKVIKNSNKHTQTGTPYYASPEIWGDKPYDYKSDIWSIGCVIYELCCLKPPFGGNSLDQLYKNVMKGVYSPLPGIYSKELSAVLGQLLQVSPNNRPTCDQILTNQSIVKRLDYTKNLTFNEKSDLLRTIKVPKNITELNKELPKKSYDAISEDRNSVAETKESKESKESKDTNPSSIPSDASSRSKQVASEKNVVKVSSNQAKPKPAQIAGNQRPSSAVNKVAAAANPAKKALNPPSKQAVPYRPISSKPNNQNNQVIKRAAAVVNNKPNYYAPQQKVKVPSYNVKENPKNNLKPPISKALQPSSAAANIQKRLIEISGKKNGYQQKLNKDIKVVIPARNYNKPVVVAKPAQRYEGPKIVHIKNK